MNQISKNVFSKGLNRDYDPAEVNAYSMVDNINGRLMFNERGTLDWVEDNGNKFSFKLEANSGADLNRYIPIGYTGDGNIKIIFSVSDTPDGVTGFYYSEIGILATDSEGNGFYETLFNDQNDINSELLNFKEVNQICARFLYENDKTVRVYWVDGVRTVAPKSNPPRVFTMAYDSSLPRNDVSAYSPVTSSVHSINSQAEFLPGIIKFRQTLSGDILTGVYQYTYRLVTNDGYDFWYTEVEKSNDSLDLRIHVLHDKGNINYRRDRLEFNNTNFTVDNLNKMNSLYYHIKSNSI